MPDNASPETAQGESQEAENIMYCAILLSGGKVAVSEQIQLNKNMAKLKLTILSITNPGFIPALTKLGEDDIGGRDKYALGRTLRDVASHRDTYEEQRVALVKKHGRPNEELLAQRLAALKASPNPETVAGQIKQVETQLAYIASNKLKSWSIDESDDLAKEKFHAEHNEMTGTTFEVFLDHKIRLPDNTKLSSAEIALLLDLIEEPESPAK